MWYLECLWSSYGEDVLISFCDFVFSEVMDPCDFLVRLNEVAGLIGDKPNFLARDPTMFLVSSTWILCYFERSSNSSYRLLSLTVSSSNNDLGRLFYFFKISWSSNCFLILSLNNSTELSYSLLVYSSFSVFRFSVSSKFTLFPPLLKNSDWVICLLPLFAWAKFFEKLVLGKTIYYLETIILAFIFLL